ncbi:guanylate kinase [Candidatus Poribacteria bacterium]|nr:guanylate kinase [Candidatus Poribacteria bacterium]
MADRSIDRPLLIVVSGPSGSGKTSVVEALRRKRDIRMSVSATTRLPRTGETDGESYHFLSVEEFRRRIAEDAFAEWAQYRDNYYGTLRSTVEEALAEGQDLLLEIDVQGASQIRARYRDAVLVFVLPPSRADLEARLTRRGTEDDEVRAKRLEAAAEEVQRADIYDYAIINRESGIDAAAETLAAIIEAERHRLTVEHDSTLKRWLND